VLAVHLKSGSKDQDMKIRLSQMKELQELPTLNPIPNNFLMLGDINEELFVKNKDDENTI